MRVDATIPEALHLCPGCENVASGALYCEDCQHAQAFYDNLLTKTGYRAPGETSPCLDLDDAPAECSGLMRGMVFALLIEGWAVAMGFAVHFIWHHWK